jgi:hypothetical protein
MEEHQQDPPVEEPAVPEHEQGETAVPSEDPDEASEGDDATPDEDATPED